MGTSVVPVLLNTPGSKLSLGQSRPSPDHSVIPNHINYTAINDYWKLLEEVKKHRGSSNILLFPSSSLHQTAQTQSTTPMGSLHFQLQHLMMFLLFRHSWYNSPEWLLVQNWVCKERLFFKRLQLLFCWTFLLLTQNIFFKMSSILSRKTN